MTKDEIIFNIYEIGERLRKRFGEQSYDERMALQRLVEKVKKLKTEE